jgi:uncharacterized protein YciI
MKIAYVYLMRDDPTVAEIAPDHAAYWDSLELDGYAGGPFEDRTGGLIVFACDSLEHARWHVEGDPFVGHNLLTASWLKQWSVQSPASVQN